MRALRLLCLILAVINSSLAQCPWHKDVPDLQTACLCAYNLGHELSVQCDQVYMVAPIIAIYIAFFSNWFNGSNLFYFILFSSFCHVPIRFCFTLSMNLG